MSDQRKVVEPTSGLLRACRCGGSVGPGGYGVRCVLETLESWRRVARLTAAAGAEAHREMYRRAAAKLTGEDLPADEPLPRVKARLGL